MDSNELKALLGTLQKLDDPPPAPVASTSRQRRDVESDIGGLLKRLRPVYDGPMPSNSTQAAPLAAVEHEAAPSGEEDQLARISKSPQFVQELSKIKADEIELRIVDNRRRIKAQYDKLLAELGVTADAAKQRAEVVAKMQQELKAADMDALSRWDALVQEQRLRFAQLGVPGFSQTSATALDIDQQKTVMKHLNELIDKG